MIDDIPGWLIAYAAWAIMLMLAVSILLLELSHAATLSISGSATGNGSQILQVAGDNLTAWWNGTAWNVTGVM